METTISEGLKAILDKKYDEAYKIFSNQKKLSIEENYYLGELYRQGLGVRVNIKLAEKYLKISAENEFNLAQLKLGELLFHQTKYEESHLYFNKCIINGMPLAKYWLGISYEYGFFYEKDIEKAVEIYKECIENDNNEENFKYILAESNERVGIYLYNKSIDVIDNEEKELLLNDAYRYIYRGAQLDNLYSKKLLIDVWSFRNIKSIGDIEYHKKLIKYECDLLHSNNEELIKFANEIIAEDQKKANYENCEIAQYFLAYRLINGYGIVKDIIKAIELLEKSSSKGFAYSQVLLSYLYFEGDGVSKDLNKAHKLIVDADNILDSDFTKYNLGNYYFSRAHDGDYELAIEIFEKILENNNPYVSIYFKLGSMYQLIGGSKQNLTLSRKYFEKATEFDDLGGIIYLKIFKFFGVGGESDYYNATKDLYSLSAECKEYNDLNILLDFLLKAHSLNEQITKANDIYNNKKNESTEKEKAIQDLAFYFSYVSEAAFNIATKIDEDNIDFCNQIYENFVVYGFNNLLKSHDYKYKALSVSDSFSKSSKFISIIIKNDYLTIEQKYSLGKLYRDLEDYKTSFLITLSLAEIGISVAQLIVGVSYLYGIGTPKNFLQSYIWLNLANSDNIDLSQKFISLLELKLNNDNILFAQKESQILNGSFPLKHVNDSNQIKSNMLDSEIDFIDNLYIKNSIQSPFNFLKLQNNPVKNINSSQSNNNISSIENNFPNKDKNILSTIFKGILLLPIALFSAYTIWFILIIIAIYIFTKLI
jgi:TPR repeat protein